MGDKPRTFWQILPVSSCKVRNAPGPKGGSSRQATPPSVAWSSARALHFRRSVLPSTPRDLVGLLEARAREYPEHGYTFFTDGEAEPQRLRYPELARRARAIAARLLVEQTAGEAVLILCPPGLDYIASFFGCLYAGAIAAPAYPPDPTRLSRTLPRLSAIVADTKARVVLSTTPIVGMAPLVGAGAPELSGLTWIAADAEEGCAASLELPSIGGDRLAFLQYTSGSTSSPKGVMLSHRNLLHNLEMIRTAFEFSPATQAAFWLPPYHDMGLIGGILAPLYAGGQSALLSPFDFLKRPMAWLEMVSRTRADTTGAPNFAFDLVVRKSRPEERAALDLSCLTLAFNAAEPIRAETMETFAAAFRPAGFQRSSLFTCFGLAEGTLLASATKRGVEPREKTFDGAALEVGRVLEVDGDAEGARRLVSLGGSPAGSQLRIVDAKTATALGERQLGEIWLRSGSVAEGYWKKELETRGTFGAFTADGEGPFLRTGDLGFIDDGELFFVSRIKDLIIIRGRNHYPQDIERAVEGAHPALRAGCGVAFGLERDGEERLAIVWEIDAGRMRDPNEVMASVKRAAAEREGVFADTVILIEARSLPKTSSGKLQRQRARAEYLERSLAIVAEWSAPRSAPVRAPTSLKDFLIERIASGLGLSEDAIDPDLPFHHYGFDSKMVVELAADLSQWTGRDLPATLAFNYPTINTLTRHLVPQEG